MTARVLPAVLLAVLLPVVACGGGGGDEAADTPDDTAAAAQMSEGADTAAAATMEGEQEPAGTDRSETRQAETRTEPRQRTEERPPARQPAATEQPEAEEEPAAEEPATVVRTAPAGAQMWATLSDSLDSETAEVGDRFAAEVTSPVTDGSYVLIPSGSRLTGHLTDVRPARGDSAAVIAIAFDSLQVRDETVPIAATVTDVKLESRSEMKDEGKKIGIGAAAGAVVGAVVGKDVKGVLIGAAGGAAAGTAIALGTQSRYAVLPAGSEVTLSLDEPVEVRLPSQQP